MNVREDRLCFNQGKKEISRLPKKDKGRFRPLSPYFVRNASLVYIENQVFENTWCSRTDQKKLSIASQGWDGST